MKRNPDLIRDILLAVEGKKTLAPSDISDLGIHGWENADVEYNAILLFEANYLIGSVSQFGQGVNIIIIERLTWDGHEFLDAARDDKRWEAAKSIVSKASGWSFEIIKPILIELAKDTIESAFGSS